MGKEVNAEIKQKIRRIREQCPVKDVLPTLAVVRIGNNPGDISYEKGIRKTMDALSMAVCSVGLSQETGEEELVATIEKLAEDEGIHGILLMQPLPQGIDVDRVKATIPPSKDVDGATFDNLGRVLAGNTEGYSYCAPSAVMALLDHYEIPLKGANVVLIGSGLVVGRPLALLLADRFATVTMANVYSKDVPEMAQKADILISACGVAGLVEATYVHEGQIVIDVGTSRKNGKICGDVNWEEVAPIVKAVTPTPGGIGSITTHILALHLMLACARACQSK